MSYVLEVTDNEMELLHNALQVHLNYLKGLQEEHEEEGLEGLEEVEPSIENEMVISDILIESYVDVQQLRVKVVNLAGRDLSTDG